ncbi:MAG: hypothetical protein KC636_01655 [Myxococcales bacterium]|nr:hypothetical protein [Myxococcales bacterium]
MPSSADEIGLLLAHADDRQPTLEGSLDESALRGSPHPEDGPRSTFLWNEIKDPNDLAEQRWGLIVPEGPRGDRLLSLVEPLIRRREEQMRAAAPVYRVPSQMTASEAAQWKRQVFESYDELRTDLARFQLILGDLDEVSIAVQQIQGTDGFVGRLAFDDDAGYEAYVDKLLRSEQAPPKHEQGRSLFFTVHDGTSATTTGHRALMEPALALIRSQRDKGKYPARELLEFGDRGDPYPGELLEQVSEPASVLFSLSHGAGAPRRGWRSEADQRQLQGAMSFGAEGLLTAADVASGAFLPGGAWFMLACFGAGTPEASKFHPWLKQLAARGAFGGNVASALSSLPPKGSRPFVAALPKAALQNPDGPLAFIGHIDLAWTYAFREVDGGLVRRRPGRFVSLVRTLLERSRAGLALRELIRFYVQANDELMSLYDEEARAAALGIPAQVDAERLGHLWMLRQDISGYVLLGDPAAQLPLALAAEEETVDVVAEFGFPFSITDAGAGASVDDVEHALARVILDRVDVAKVAAERGLDARDLAERVDRYRKAGRGTVR